MAGLSRDTRLRRAVRLHQRAVAENDAAHPAVASVLLSRALSMITEGSDPDEVDFGSLSPVAAELAVQILITRAKSQAELSGLSEALEVLDLATAWARHRELSSLNVSISNQRGLLQLRFGNTAAALAEFVRAEQRFDSAPASDVCKVLLNRGVARIDRGEFGVARRDLARCVDLARRSELATLEAMAEHNLGYLEFLTGNLARGLDVMQAAARPDAGIPIGISFLDRARLLVEAGLTREADRSLAEASEIFHRDRMAQDLAETELARAECALVAGEVSEARRFAASARDRFRRRGNDRWRRAAELVLLQGDLAFGRPGSRLVGPALRLRDEFEAAGLRLQARTAALLAVEAQLAAGGTGEARDVGPLRLPRRGDPVPSRLHHHYVAARVARAAGRRREAARRVRRGLSELADYQARFGSIDMRTAAAVHGRRLAALDLELALSSRRPSLVVAAAERVRAVSSRLPPVHAPADAQTAEWLAELRRTVESLRTAAQQRVEQAPLQRRRAELEREITARGWTLAGAGPARRAARLDEIRAALASHDSTMVMFVESAGVLHAVVLGGGRLGLREIGDATAAAEQISRVRADLDVLANPMLPGGLRASVRTSLRRSVTALDDMLLRPLELTERVVLVTTGSLGQLPWSALPSLRAVPVVAAPSATAWMTAALAARTHRAKVVALAGPDLARAEDEVAQVIKSYQTSASLTGAAADRVGLSGAMRTAQVVHIAAHGVHQTENPLFSSLRLADGPLFAHELAASLSAQHVVLSACELGLATVRPGDEALGLTSVLLQLGIRSVVAGVARVGDDVAADTMNDYHHELASGRDTAEALAVALGSADPERPAPFVCFGSGWRLVQPDDLDRARSVA